MKQELRFKTRYFSFLLLALILAGYIISMLLATETGNVGVIPVHGTIGEGLSGVAPEQVIELIDKANENPSIAAIVFDINSRGGSPVASQRIVDKIKRINKTTIAIIRDIGASSGYWIASACNHVIASKYSITGSIGVYGSYIGYYGLMKDYNVTYERFVSGELKDMGSPFKQPTQVEKQLLQSKIKLMQGYFLEDVKQNRNLSEKELSQISTGVILLGKEAKALGLVDEVGGDTELEAYLNSLNISPSFTSYKLRHSLIKSLSSMLTRNPIA